jgi:hypothetical protein
MLRHLVKAVRWVGHFVGHRFSAIKLCKNAEVIHSHGM